MDPYHKRKISFEPFLRGLGLHDAFGRLSRRAQEALWRCKCPDPILEYDPSFPDLQSDRELRRKLETALATPEITVGEVSMPVREFIPLIAGLKGALDNTDLTPFQPITREFFETARQRVEDCYIENWNEATARLMSALNTPLVAHSRLDTRLLAVVLDLKLFPATGKGTVRGTVTATEPQMMRVSLDGTPRPAYRAAITWSNVGVKWISWNRDQVGPRATRDEMPVYVQSHALKQLQRRVNLPSLEPYAECWMSESLGDPRITEWKGDDALVEYRLKGRHLGYLVVTLLADMVVVRTFKFLTMEGTPEARKLKNRLGLTRRDIDWLRLDELSAFTHSDLNSDAELCAILSECGCGHLLSINEFDPAPAPRGYAAELRRYLCLAA